MKIKSIFKYFAFFIAIGIMSCGSDDSGGDGDSVTGITAISSDNIVFEGEAVTFTVLNNLGVDVTDSATYTIDGVEISSPFTFTEGGVYVVVVTVGDFTTEVTVYVPSSVVLTTSSDNCNYLNGQITFTATDNFGNVVTALSTYTVAGVAAPSNPHTFVDAGTYDVVATYGPLTSNTVSITVNPPTSLTLETSLTSCFVTESTAVTVSDNFGNDVTSSSDITVGGAVMAANPHTFASAGSFDFTAGYYGLTSNTVTVNAVASTHTTKVMVEDYTGTWCGYCPRLAYKIDELAVADARVVPVALHSESSSHPLNYPDVSILESAYSISGYPTGKINRTITWNETDSHVLSQLDDIKPLGLAIDSNISGSTLSVTAKVHYDIDVTDAHKLVVYVLEDDLFYDQVNYMNGDSSSPWYGAGDPIVGFEHDNVVRTTLTNVLGDAIPGGETVMGNTFTQDFNYTIPGGYAAANLELVACVVDSTGKVVNAQLVHAGSDQAFD